MPAWRFAAGSGQARSHSLLRTVPGPREDAIVLGDLLMLGATLHRGVTVSGPRGTCPLLKEPADDPSPRWTQLWSLIHLDLPSFHGSLLSSVVCRDCPTLHSTRPTIGQILLSRQRGPQPSVGRDPTSGHRGTVTRPGREKLSMWVPTAHSHASIHIRGQRGVSWTSRLQS